MLSLVQKLNPSLERTRDSGIGFQLGHQWSRAADNRRWAEFTP